MRFAGIGFGPTFEGHLLVAPPGNTDTLFTGSIVYVCTHAEEGAMGLVLNQAAPERPLAQVLRQLDIIDDEDSIKLGPKVRSFSVLKGGPCEEGRGFVLHSSDYFMNGDTLAIDDGLNLTTSVDILRAIAMDEGPRRAILAFGYAHWEAGQIEREIRDGSWLVSKSDEEFVFGVDHDAKHARALRGMGIKDVHAFAGSGGRA